MQNDNFNGLSRGQVKQIIRRKMTCKIKVSDKVYNRKKLKKVNI